MRDLLGDLLDTLRDRLPAAPQLERRTLIAGGVLVAVIAVVAAGLVLFTGGTKAPGAAPASKLRFPAISTTQPCDNATAAHGEEATGPEAPADDADAVPEGQDPAPAAQPGAGGAAEAQAPSGDPAPTAPEPPAASAETEAGPTVKAPAGTGDEGRGGAPAVTTTTTTEPTTGPATTGPTTTVPREDEGDGKDDEAARCLTGGAVEGADPEASADPVDVPTDAALPEATTGKVEAVAAKKVEAAGVGCEVAQQSVRSFIAGHRRHGLLDERHLTDLTQLEAGLSPCPQAARDAFVEQTLHPYAADKLPPGVVADHSSFHCHELGGDGEHCHIHPHPSGHHAPEAGPDVKR